MAIISVNPERLINKKSISLIAKLMKMLKVKGVEILCQYSLSPILKRNSFKNSPEINSERMT